MTTVSDINLTGAELAILRHRIEGVNKKMANTVVRTGRSGVLNRARDFSVCILTAGCDLLSAAEGLPIHTLCGPDMMARWMLTFHPSLKRGDAFLHNSPYHGNSHAADQVVLVPVFDDEEIHRFTIVVKAHQADIGNSVPTTLHATARDLYEEGAMIFPCVRLQQDFKFNEDLLRMCRMRIRVPDQWYGDLLATLGAARIGERELISLGREIGWAKLLSFPEKWFEYSENRMVEALRKMSSGEAEATSIHDAFPGTEEGGIEIRAKVRIDADEAMVHVDFTGCPDCLPNGLNLTEATSRTAAMVGIFNSIDPTVPKNAGSIRRINIDLRENAIVGVPRHPTSCSVATTNIADHATNCVQMSIAAISEGSGMAETGYAFSPTTGTISGIDPRNGKPFVNMIFLGHTAGAATGHGDRWLTLLHVGNGGLCNIDGAELTELYHPVVIKERKLVTDSEGAGKYIGASALQVEYGPVGGDLELVFASDGTDHAPQGVRGGQPGGTADQFLRKASGELRRLDKVTRVTLRQGETTVGVACGGGGYGHPHERDPAKVANDVTEKWISRERATSVYGVAFDENGRPDLAKTKSLREGR